MKEISALAAFAAFAVIAMISSVTVPAPVEPGAFVEFVTESTNPVAQELPAGGHLAQN
jgi:hypothetical protein